MKEKLLSLLKSKSQEMYKNHTYLSTKVTNEDLANSVADEYGVLYSDDGKRLLKCENKYLAEYTVRDGTSVICDVAFLGCTSLAQVAIGNSVTKIGKSSFQRCPKLVGELIIPNSVTSIGRYAFNGCLGLTQLTIGNHVTSIGYGAFKRCSGLTEVAIPNSVSTIGDGAFRDCTELSRVTLEDGNKTLSMSTDAFINCPIETLYIGRHLGDYSKFENKTSLTSITITNGVTAINPSAFRGCSSLMELTIPNSVETIGNYAFYNCKNITELTIPNSVTSLGNYAFSGCTGITEVTIGNSVTSIGNYAFSGCAGITEVNFNAIACTSAGSSSNRAFYDCDNISTFNFGDNVTIIPPSLCYNMTALTSVTIPNRVTEIGSRAFEGCSGLAKYEVSEGNECYCDKEGVLYTRDMTTLIQFPAASSITSYDIPESVITIGPCAFTNCSGLTEVTIGNGVTKIGERAFANCTGLKTVNFDAIACTATGPYFCDEVFGGCSNISKVNIGYNVTIIPNGLCCGLTGLTQVTIPEGVTKIGDGAFSSCSGLKNVTIPYSVTTIGKSAFYFCESLERIEVPDLVTSIGDFAFMSCRNLEKVTLGTSLKYVGIKSFVDCPALEIIRSRNPEPPKCSGAISFDACYILYVPNGSKAAYANSEGWNKFLCIMEGR